MAAHGSLPVAAGEKAAALSKIFCAVLKSDRRRPEMRQARGRLPHTGVSRRKARLSPGKDLGKCRPRTKKVRKGVCPPHKIRCKIR